MKKIVVFFTLFSLLFGSSIDKKIKAQKREIDSKKIEYNKMDKRLSSVAKKIIDAKAERTKIDKKLSSLEKNINKNQSEFDKLNSKKRNIDQKLSTLSDAIDEKKDKFIALVADKFSMALVLEELDKPTSESVMLQEAYGVYVKENRREIDLLKKDINTLKIKEEYFINKQENIKRSISVYKKEIEDYNAQKDKKTELLTELARDKAIYKKRFDRIRKSKRALQRKLAKLKIVKEEEIVYKEERKKARRADKRRSEREIREVKKEEIPIEEYTAPVVKTANYGGDKTISPLTGSRLIKKFGTYVDPIYKFKIFNKSITLKAPHKGSKVKSVLSGKVVFAENSGGMLGKVVIVEHANSLHTIYAKLSRLAPGIHVGKHLRKGSIIGKVNKSLMFEVTRNNKHMNPLKLIRL